MPPTPIYRVKYNGTNLPGYLQNEDVPIEQTAYNVKVLGRDGGFLGEHGYNFKEITVNLLLLSRLDRGATGLQHLNDCKAQWRDALAIAARADGLQPLYIGETDRYVNAVFVGATAPLQAPVTNRVSYTMRFMAEPWFLSATPFTDTRAASVGIYSVTPGNSRKTYPVFTIATGITAITIEDDTVGGSGNYFILSGTHTNPWVVDCGKLTITENGVNVISVLISDPQFGIWWQGGATDTMDINVIAKTGSGNITIDMPLRYER